MVRPGAGIAAKRKERDERRKRKSSSINPNPGLNVQQAGTIRTIQPATSAQLQTRGTQVPTVTEGTPGRQTSTLVTARTTTPPKGGSFDPIPTTIAKKTPIMSKQQERNITERLIRERPGLDPLVKFNPTFQKIREEQQRVERAKTGTLQPASLEEQVGLSKRKAGRFKTGFDIGFSGGGTTDISQDNPDAQTLGEIAGKGALGVTIAAAPTRAGLSFLGRSAVVIGGAAGVTFLTRKAGRAFQPDELKNFREDVIGEDRSKEILRRARLEERVALQKSGAIGSILEDINPALSTQKDVFRQSVASQLREQGFRGKDVDLGVSAFESERRVQSVAQGAGDVTAAGLTEIRGRRIIQPQLQKLGSVAGRDVGKKVASRTFAPFFRLGAAEGASVELTRGVAQDTPISPANVIGGAGAGGASAATLGSAIVAGAATRSRTGKALNVVANVADPFEKPGDILADIGTTTAKTVGTKTLPTPVITITGGETVTFGKGTKPTTAIPIPTRTVQPTLDVDTRPTRAFQPVIQPIITPTPIPTPTPTPSITPAITPTITPSLVPTPAFVPTFTPVPIPTQTPVTTKTPVTTFQRFVFPPLVPFIPGGGIGQGGKKKKRVGRRKSRRAPQFAAIALGLKGGVPKGKLSGFEFRGL